MKKKLATLIDESDWRIKGTAHTSRNLIKKVRESMENGNDEILKKSLDELFPNGL